MPFVHGKDIDSTYLAAYVLTLGYREFLKNNSELIERLDDSDNKLKTLSDDIEKICKLTPG